MAPCPAGENDVALAPGYAANVEIASADAAAGRAARAAPAPEQVHTPGADDDRGGRRRARRARRRAAEGLPGRRRGARAACMVVVRGDHRVNEIKLAQRAGRGRSGPRARTSSPSASARPASSARSARDVPMLLDDGGRRRAATCRAPTAPDHHLRGVEPGRDFAFERVDVRTRRGRRHGRRARRSASSRRSRSATSSSSARATPSRSARPTSTSTASEQLDRAWAPTASARRASPPPPSSSSPTSRASPGRARSRRGTSSSSALGKPGTPERAGRRGALRRAARGRARRAARRPRRRPGREVRRRRAARRAAAPDGRQALAGVRRAPRRRCAAGASDRDGGVPLEGAAEAVPSCGRASRRRRSARLDASARAARARPLRPAAARDAARRAAEPVDDPQRDRLRAPRADPRLPRRSPSLATTASTRCPRSLFAVIALGRLRSTGSPRASPASTAASARCWTRSSTGCSCISGVVVCWHFELLPRWALARARRARAAHARRRRVRACAAASSCEINWPGRWASGR